MVLVYTSAPFRGGTHLPQGYAGSRSDSSEPIPMVQCGCLGLEEGQYSALLHGLQAPQRTYEEGLIPFAHIQEALESMAGLAHFLSMDFKSGFWQIKMAPGSQQYTAFMVGNLGFYEFTHMPFGLCNAPATFQGLMQNALGGLNLMYCVIYLDDIIAFGHTEEEHLECLCMVFERFQEFNLKLKPSKCSFFQSEIMYLAHHILQRGILLSRENVWAVQEFPMPETYMQVHTFCGLAGHYGRFIKGFANIVCPLYDVLGKEVKMGPVDLPPEAQEAVNVLKGKV